MNISNMCTQCPLMNTFVTIFVMNICTENSDFKFFKTNKYHSLDFNSCLAADSFLRENFDEKKIEHL